MRNKVNISQIAKDLDLSISTVSRALSGNGRISEVTRQRIADYLSEKELVPNSREKRYTDTATKTISVVMTEEKYLAKVQFFYDIFLGVYDYFSIRGYQVNLIKITRMDVSNLVNAVEDHVMDGIILMEIMEKSDVIPYLKTQNIPFVVLGSYEDSSVMQVDVDYENGSNEITNALISKGFHKLAIMCGDRDNPVNERKLKGIKNAHVQNYMMLDRKFIFYDTEYENIAELAIEKILEANMDCILCMDDCACMSLLGTIKKMKKEVPKDIRIATLYGGAFLEKCYPSISMIYYDMKQMAKEASRMLYVYLTEHKHLSKIVLGYELKMKDSTS